MRLWCNGSIHGSYPWDVGLNSTGRALIENKNCEYVRMYYNYKKQYNRWGFLYGYKQDNKACIYIVLGLALSQFEYIKSVPRWIIPAFILIYAVSVCLYLNLKILRSNISVMQHMIITVLYSVIPLLISIIMLYSLFEADYGHDKWSGLSAMGVAVGICLAIFATVLFAVVYWLIFGIIRFIRSRKKPTNEFV